METFKKNITLSLKKSHTKFINKRQSIARTSKNMHKNFLNLDPVFEQKRKDIVNRIARHWQKKLGSQLMNQVEVKREEQFLEFLREGNTVSINELNR